MREDTKKQLSRYETEVREIIKQYRGEDEIQIELLTRALHAAFWDGWLDYKREV